MINKISRHDLDVRLKREFSLGKYKQNFQSTMPTDQNISQTKNSSLYFKLKVLYNSKSFMRSAVLTMATTNVLF